MYWPGDPDSQPSQGNEGSPRTVRIISGVESREGEPLSKWALLMVFTIDRYFRLDQNRSRGQERKNGRVGEERTKKRGVKALRQGMDGALSGWGRKWLLVNQEASPHALPVQRQRWSHWYWGCFISSVFSLIFFLRLWGCGSSVTSHQMASQAWKDLAV